ncbi:unnamed protein product [Rhodiola kirilowii]
MSCLSWNCRGLGGAATVRSLANLVRIYNPSMVGVMETKADTKRMEYVQKHLGFKFGLSVERRGKSGGLALWWKDSINVVVQSYSDYHIDAIVEEETPFRVTLFYGHPVTNRRAETWNLLRTLRGALDLPWLVFGDFNEVLFGWEVKGRCVRGEWQMKSFRSVIQECGLIDLGFRGSNFTFSNRRKGLFETKARLDRAFANCSWRNLFPNAEVVHEISGMSDHRPIVIRWEGVQSTEKLKLFRFEPMWLKHKDYVDKVREIWGQFMGTDIPLTECLARSATSLREWGKSCFGNVNKKVNALKKKLDLIQQQNRTSEVIEEETKINKEIDDWLYKEELYWKQRSRADWLKEGDRNTRFFHLKASQRWKANRIRKIQKNGGEWITEEEDICREVVCYFKNNIFKSSSGRSQIKLERELSFIPQCISGEMADVLSAPFSELEVQDALFQMYPTKAPGPDGLSALFYQKSWVILKERVTECILNMLNSGQLEENLNRTLITLVPKTKEPKRIEEYRPISLCNVVAKMVTKVLANRLKTVLPHIISDSQSAFVPGRLISDNILAAHELIHFINTRGKQRVGYLSLKLDISKAYDRVEWDYLEAIHRRMGFPDKWTKLIMACVKSVYYTIRVNDRVTEEIWPERGLRQGDPLSPYLFLICTEWFAQKLKQWQGESRLQGIRICRGAPDITHLMFADDSVIFLRASMSNVANLKRILMTYEELSGQKVNLAKSEICFSKNVSADLQGRICAELRVRQVKNFSRYLGLPIAFSHNKTDLFKFIVERVWQKVQGWKEQTLSMAGKETLVKSILQAIPTYAMMCFKLPDSLCKRIIGIISRYWWSNKGGGRCIYWGSYKLLCKAKEVGGLGFRDFVNFNDALLAKQIWRLVTNPDALVSRLIRAKYYKDTDVLQSHLGFRPSFAWRSLWNVKNKISQWISYEGQPQQPVWKGEDCGMFSVKSAYMQLKKQSELSQINQRGEQASLSKTQAFWRRIWRLKAQPKVKVFAWRVFHNFLPSADNLARRHCNVKLECQVCGWRRESTIHTLLHCWWAKAFWGASRIDCSFLDLDFSNPGDWLWFCVSKFSNQELSVILQGARQIWFNRNLVVNGKTALNPFEEAESVVDTVHLSLQTGHRFVVTNLYGDVEWIPPEIGFVKINVDGAWDRETLNAGIGICCRDSSGTILFVEASPVARLSSSFEAEFRSLFRSLELAETKKLRKVIFELDSAEVYNILQGSPMAKGSAAGLLTSCRCMLRRNSCWFLSLIPREANNWADALSRKAKEDEWTWKNHEAIPWCIKQLVLVLSFFLSLLFCCCAQCCLL